MPQLVLLVSDMPNGCFRSGPLVLRQLLRELLTAKCNRTRVTNRIQGLLAGSGVSSDLRGDVPGQLQHLQPWDGSPLPPAWRACPEREGHKVGFLTAQIMALEAERWELLRTGEEPVVALVSGALRPRRCSGPEDRHRSIGPRAADRAMAVLGDGGSTTPEPRLMPGG